MKRTHALTVALAALLPLALSAGCFSLDKPAPRKQVLLIEAHRSALVPPAGAPVMHVQRLAISPAFAGRNLVYRTGDNTYESDFYAEWLAPPAQMITDAVRRWFSSGGRYAVVPDAASHVEPDVVLEGVIAALYADLRAGSGPAAVIEMELFLVAHPLTDPSVLQQADLHVSLPLESAGPEAIAAGLSQALTDALAAWESPPEE